MDSVTGVMPENLIVREMRKEARQWIISQPWPGHIKRDALFAWARTVGVRLSEKEVREVQNSGFEPETRL